MPEISKKSWVNHVNKQSNKWAKRVHTHLYCENGKHFFLLIGSYQLQKLQQNAINSLVQNGKPSKKKNMTFPMENYGKLKCPFP